MRNYSEFGDPKSKAPIAAWGSLFLALGIRYRRSHRAVIRASFRLRVAVPTFDVALLPALEVVQLLLFFCGTRMLHLFTQYWPKRPVLKRVKEVIEFICNTPANELHTLLVFGPHAPIGKFCTRSWSLADLRTLQSWLLDAASWPTPLHYIAMPSSWVSRHLKAFVPQLICSRAEYSIYWDPSSTRLRKITTNHMPELVAFAHGVLSDSIESQSLMARSTQSMVRFLTVEGDRQSGGIFDFLRGDRRVPYVCAALILRASQPWSTDNHCLFPNRARANAIRYIYFLYALHAKFVRHGGICAKDFSELVLSQLISRC